MDQDRERRAEAIFETLLSVPTLDRPAAAAAACGADAGLLARVRQLMDGLADAGGFMSDATVGADETVGPGSPVTDPAAVPIGAKPGDRVGRYKLLEQIGEGGFGVVFMAEQQVPVRRQVALKVIKLGMDTREVVARFEAERQALALMDHPNIARVLDAGATDAGRPYFVMELVRGSPITDYCDKRHLTTAQRAGLMADVCRAVQHAHSKGVIHRDLKPSNVLVAVGDDDRPVPKVIDFGIAKATQAKLTDRTLFTGFRQLIGTPQYMSPEQADSDGVDIDTRTDVYSLGVLLYELLVGTTPIDARQLRSAAFEAMRRMISDVEPPRPSTRLSGLGQTLAAVAVNRGTDAKQLGRQLSGELDWIVMRALEKDRSRRYDTAAALADDLGRYLAGDAVLAGPVSGTYRLRKTLRRYRSAVAVGAAIAAVLLLGVAGTTVGLVQATRQRAAAVASERRALAGEQEARRQKAVVEEQREVEEQEWQASQAVVTFLTDDVLAKADPATTRDHALSDTLVKSLIEPALATVDQRFGKQPTVRAAVQGALASTLSSLGRYDLAERQAKACWEGYRSRFPDDDPQTFEAMGLYGLTLDKQGHYAEAEPLLKRAWETSRRVLGEDDPITLGFLLNYSMNVMEQRRHADAGPLVKLAWESYRRKQGEAGPEALLALTNYATELGLQSHWAEAEPLYKQAWDTSRRVKGDDHPDTLQAMCNYANAIMSQGRMAESEPLSKQAWNASRRVLGDDHRETLMSLANYAMAVDSQGRHAEAEPLFKQAWDASQRALGESYPDTIEYLLSYAEVVDAQGRHAEAEPLLKRCWETSRRVLGEDHWDTTKALAYYAAAVLAQGRYADAEPLLKQAWETDRRVRGADDPDTAWALGVYAMAIYEQGRRTEAEPLFKQASDVCRRVLGGDAPFAVLTEGNYAEVIELDGRHAEAAPLLKHSWDVDRRTVGDDSSQTLQVMVAYAAAVNGQGDHAQALPIFKQAWDTARRALGDDDPSTLAAKAGYAHAVDGLGRHAEAEPILREAVDAFARAQPIDDGRREALLDLGECLVGSAKWVDAEPVLRECWAWDQHHADPARPGAVPDSLRLLDRCRAAQGKPPEPRPAAAAPATRPASTRPR